MSLITLFFEAKGLPLHCLIEVFGIESSRSSRDGPRWGPNSEDSCNAPLRFGQPFVLFRLRVCMARMGVGGGVGLGFGS